MVCKLAVCISEVDAALEVGKGSNGAVAFGTVSSANPIHKEAAISGLCGEVVPSSVCLDAVILFSGGLFHFVFSFVVLFDYEYIISRLRTVCQYGIYKVVSGKAHCL